MTTFERDDGAVIGTHTVTVRKLTSIPTGPYRGAPGDGEIDSAAIERARQETAKQIEAAKKSRSELPAKYADRTTSDLRKEVREGDNVIDIELAD